MLFYLVHFPLSMVSNSKYISPWHYLHLLVDETVKYVAPEYVVENVPILVIVCPI